MDIVSDERTTKPGPIRTRPPNRRTQLPRRHRRRPPRPTRQHLPPRVHRQPVIQPTSITNSFRTVQTGRTITIPDDSFWGRNLISDCLDNWLMVVASVVVVARHRTKTQRRLIVQRLIVQFIRQLRHIIQQQPPLVQHRHIVRRLTRRHRRIVRLVRHRQQPLLLVPHRPLGQRELLDTRHTRRRLQQRQR